MTRISLRAPATIANVGPGFDIFAVALEAPRDRFKISLNNSSGEISISFQGGEGDIPVDPDKNTAGLTARHILSKQSGSVGVKIEIIKGMPSCAGLGSSAASAAACAFALDRLLRAEMSQEEALEAARRGEVASGGTPHADNVAGCLLGGFVFVRGYDPLEVVRIPLPEIPFVIRVIRKAQTTTRALIPEQFSLADLKRQTAHCADVIHAVMAGDIEAFGRAIDKDLVSEPVRSRHIPGYGELKRDLRRAGAFGANVCGGGSSMFAVCPSHKTEEIAALMRSRPGVDGTSPQVLITKSSNRGIEIIDGL